VDRELGKERLAGKCGRQLVAVGSDVPAGFTRLNWPTTGVRGTFRIIAPDEVHVWGWAFEPSVADLPAHIEILDQQERERMQRFHFAPDRARYAVAHANLRRILGAYLQQPAAGLRFDANGFGKPELYQNESSSSLQFSLSHCRSIGVLAVAKGRPVGVDVEEVRPIEPEVADSHFSVSERAQLNRLQGDAWLLGFYRCWTRKEAILKAEGVGLSRALDSFDVSLLPDETAKLLGTRKHFSYPWTLHDLLPSEGTIGSVATAQPHTRLICFSFVNDSLS
jgi:4'-phosphopantetheinyl transferase